jgi:hypothetical protein
MSKEVREHNDTETNGAYSKSLINSPWKWNHLWRTVLADIIYADLSHLPTTAHEYYRLPGATCGAMPRGQLLDDSILKHGRVTHIMHHWLTAPMTNLVHKRSLFSSVMRPWHLQVHFFSIEQSKALPKLHCQRTRRAHAIRVGRTCTLYHTARFIMSIHSYFSRKLVQLRILLEEFCVVRWKSTDISEEHVVSIFRVEK